MKDKKQEAGSKKQEVRSKKQGVRSKKNSFLLFNGLSLFLKDSKYLAMLFT